MFIGQYQHVMDEKGRVSIPSKFREDLSEKFVVVKGLETCLFVYSEDVWAEVVKKLNDPIPFEPVLREFARKFLSRASEESLDKQGRLLIPPRLREYAKLDREVTIIGVSSRLEIWDSKLWDEYDNSDDLDFNVLADYYR